MVLESRLPNLWSIIVEKMGTLKGIVKARKVKELTNLDIFIRIIHTKMDSST